MKNRSKTTTTTLIATMAVIVVAASLPFTGGCETEAQTGSLKGAGIGAIAGQLIGGDSKATMIGAAIGTGAGYLIGNAKDKEHAEEINQKGGSHNEVGPFGGTRWTVKSILPRDAVKPYQSKVVEFKPDGHIVTTTTKPDGSVEASTERYRVVGNTLILNDDGFLINTHYELSRGKLTLSAEKWTAVLEKL